MKNIKEKIAVINRTNFKNFGSVLQCYALCKTIENLGYESEIVWVRGSISKNFDIRIGKVFSSLFTVILHPYLFNHLSKNIIEVKETVINEKTCALFDEFVCNYIKQQQYSLNELKKLSKTECYKKIVCGSDQIWNPYSLYLDPLFFARFAPISKRIAYAPSLGCDELPKYNKRKLKKYVTEMSHVSVRETMGQKLLYDLCGRKYNIVLDPTLLISKETWNHIAKEYNASSYVVCYFLDEPSIDNQNRILNYAKENEKKIIVLGVSLNYISASLSHCVIKPDCGPCEFLGYLQNADAVITDSYHGMLFSILFRRNFASIERIYREHNQSSRQKSVLSDFDLESHYSNIFSANLLNPINYDFVIRKLEKRKEESLAFLKNALM